MSRMDQPTADDVILDLLVDGVEPTHENLMVAIAAYPQHREVLVAFFADLAVQTALMDGMTPSGCSAEQFANIGVSRVLSRRHDAALQAATDGRSKSGGQETAPLPARLSQLVRAKGLTKEEVAARVGLDLGLKIKLDLHRIPAPRPMEMFGRLAEELGVPPAHIIATATGPPLSSSRGNLRKAKGPIKIEPETFEAAIRASTLSDELKAYWLARIADADEPTA
jgi:transcriptional regulator with XRE-family HTH domain